MRKAIGLAVAGVGVVLIVFGIQAQESVKSRFQEMWDGTPSQQTMLLLGGGAACVGLGLGAAFTGGSKKG
jgi:hypothetical protein